MRLISKETIQKYSQTGGERNEIDEILEPILLTQRIYGLQILNPEWSWKKYGVYRIVSFALCIYTTIGTLEVCMKATDLNLIIEGVFTMLVNVQMTIKLLLYADQYKNFQKNYVKAKNYIYNLIKKSPKKRGRLTKNLKRLVKMLYFVIVCPVLTYLFVALWFACNGNRVTLSQSTSTLMPMTTPYYELGLLIHLSYLFEASFCLVVIELWFIFISLFFFEASELLIEILDVKRNGDSDEVYAERLDDSLRKFYVIHVEIMEYLNLFNTMYKWICLVPLVSILVDTSLFLMLLKEDLKMQILVVMLPVSAVIFVYSWFGDRISSTVKVTTKLKLTQPEYNFTFALLNSNVLNSLADEINMAFLHFNWTSMRLKDKKKYYIMACYMNKKFGVKTAVGNDLSFLTLTTIYKASYQMFTVFSTT